MTVMSLFWAGGGKGQEEKPHMVDSVPLSRGFPESPIAVLLLVSAGRCWAPETALSLTRVTAL